jgi:hypothetical protein
VTKGGQEIKFIEEIGEFLLLIVWSALQFLRMVIIVRKQRLA